MFISEQDQSKAGFGLTHGQQFRCIAVPLTAARHWLARAYHRLLTAAENWGECFDE